MIMMLLALASIPLALAEVQGERFTRWDIQDNRPGTLDSGAILNAEDAFDGFALLHVAVDGHVSAPTTFVRSLNLAFDGTATWDSLHPAVVGDIVVSRSILVSQDGSYARYIDTFTNFGQADAAVDVSFGGSVTRRTEAMRAFVSRGSQCGHDTEAYLISGATTPEGAIQYATGLVYASANASSPTFRLSNPRNDPFHTSLKPADAGYVSTVTQLTLAPGETQSLLYFVINQNGLAKADEVLENTCRVARRLAKMPNLEGLTPLQRQQVRNWSIEPNAQPAPRPDLQQASIRDLSAWLKDGDATVPDLVFAYLERIARYDRHGLSLNAIISINPDVYRDARAREQESRSGRSHLLWGMPYIAKDNIDIAGYPTSIGVKALADAPVDGDAAIITRLKQAGAVFLAKSNMDDFALGGFAASSLAGKTVNMFSPLHNASGSSGGSAVATSVGMGAFSLGSDTCRSLSNPASYNALATMRATRERVDIAGVAPLWPLQDVVGPLTRTVDDLEIVLGTQLGADFAQEGATPFSTPLRLGVARQRFIGFSGETDVAEALEPVLEQLRDAGFELVDVEIPNLDALFDAAKTSYPGFFKQAINEYLATRSVGHRSLKSVYDTGQTIARSDAWLEDEIAAALPTEQLTQQVIAGRKALRAGIVDAMDAASVSALLFPAAHTQPDPLESMRWALGTCKLSAQSGLPQVTVPVTFLDDRWPLGLSLLGRPITEAQLLQVAEDLQDLTQVRQRAQYLTH